MNFKELAEQTEEYIIEQRRYFHAHPELSWQEFNTTKALAARIEEMGLEPHFFKNCQGLWTEVKGEAAGANAKTVALRADIDALPVEEHTGLPFASENKGIMHACGHDCHMSMLLGGVKMLLARKAELKGTVKILFQPAEESGEGANRVIAEGFLDGVDAIYGAHIWGDFDAPYINVEPGPRMASCDIFEIDVEGLSAHGSAPHQGIDAIVASAAMINQIQTLVSRKNDPLNPLVVTIGKIEGGQRFNIIANHVHMDGTVRTLSAETRNKVEGWIDQIVQSVATAHGATAKLTYHYTPPAVINEHEDLNIIAKNALEKMYGPEGGHHLEKMMGAEDYAFFMEKVPGIFGFVGGRNAAIGCTELNHNDKFTVDESVLKRGAAMYAQFAFDYLEAKA